MKSALPALRNAIATETDPAAAREEIRTLALIGDASDVATAISAASKLPPDADSVVADAVGRRGGQDALALYESKLRALREVRGFWRAALWNEPALVGPTAGRLLAANDERGWAGLLAELLEAAWTLPAEHAVAGLDASSEEIRNATAWYLVRGYELDPSKIREPLRTALTAARSEEASDREDFARELLRRMLGQPASQPERWLRWLATKEADQTLTRLRMLDTWLTPEELTIRQSRCKQLPVSCPVSVPRGRAIPSTPVLQAAFEVPGTLPPGVISRLGTDMRGCKWVGVASATVDRAGRVQTVDLTGVESACKETLETLIRLTYAKNASIASPTTSGNILLVKDKGATPCFDEIPGDLTVYRTGDDVAAPVIKRRAEPVFPDSVRRSMPPGSHVLVIADSVITRAGCVRSIRLLAQSPFPGLNAAAALALSKWTFEPGRLNGQPVDTIFNLTVMFTLR